MVQILREEEQDDIAHRDRCENAEAKNGNELEDSAHAIKKAEEKIGRLGDSETDLSTQIDTVKQDINKTLTDLAERKKLRTKEYEDFKQAVKDSQDAIKLLEQAITTLANFYEKAAKETKASLLAKHKEEPSWSKNPDVAPETTWKAGDYSHRRGEGEGIVAILSMIKEDVEKDLVRLRSDDAEAQTMYDKEISAFESSLEKKKAVQLAKEQELVDVKKKISDAEDAKTAASDDKAAEEKLKESLAKDCGWVKTHFDSRRDKRKAEMDALVEAKGYLAGVEAF